MSEVEQLQHWMVQQDRAAKSTSTGLENGALEQQVRARYQARCRQPTRLCSALWDHAEPCTSSTRHVRAVKLRWATMEGVKDNDSETHTRAFRKQAYVFH